MVGQIARLRLGRCAGLEGSGVLQEGLARLRRSYCILLVDLGQEGMSLFRSGPKKESAGKVIEGVLFFGVP